MALCHHIIIRGSFNLISNATTNTNTYDCINVVTTTVEASFLSGRIQNVYKLNFVKSLVTW